MNHCPDHTPLVERVAVVEVRCKSNEAFTQDVHDDHEKTKSRVNANEKDILKIKTTVAIYSGIGATLATVAIKLLGVIVKTSWVQQSFFYCRVVWGMVFPDSHAGN